MAKRFIDTGLFDDDWFMDLPKDAKIFWLYLITKCDHAGIIKLNEKLCQLQTGIKNLDTVRQQLGNRIVTVSQQLFFIPKFVEYQYPGFPDTKFKMAQSAIEILERYGLILDGRLTVAIQSTNSHGNGNGNGSIGGVGEKEKTWRDDYSIYLADCKQGYKTFMEDEELLKKQSRLNPGINVRLSIEKGYTNFWSTEQGWKHKKASKSKTLDWNQTIINSIGINKVYYTKQELENQTK